MGWSHLPVQPRGKCHAYQRYLWSASRVNDCFVGSVKCGEEEDIKGLERSVIILRLPIVQTIFKENACRGRVEGQWSTTLFAWEGGQNVANSNENGTWESQNRQVNRHGLAHVRTTRASAQSRLC